MQDTIVGILGVVLVVGGMMAALELRDAGAPVDEEGTREGETGPPSALGVTRWQASCQVLELSWRVPLDELASHTGPWAPAESPTPGRGTALYRLVACVESALDGTAEGPVAGGAFAIAIEPPPHGANASASAWYAVPERFALGSRLDDALAARSFLVTPSEVRLDASGLPLGAATLAGALETPNGTLEVTATLSPGAMPFARVVAQAAPVPSPGVLVGSTEGAARGGTATVSASGETWVARLGLAPVPDAVRLLGDAALDLRLVTVPTDAETS